MDAHIVQAGARASAPRTADPAPVAPPPQPPPDSVAADWIPATMLAAPKRMKQPNITTPPCRQLIRPVSISKPTEAIAITATTVATVPSKVPCIQRIAFTITPEPCGSVYRSWAKVLVEMGTKQSAKLVRIDGRTDPIPTPVDITSRQLFHINNLKKYRNIK